MASKLELILRRFILPSPSSPVQSLVGASQNPRVWSSIPIGDGHTSPREPGTATPAIPGTLVFAQMVLPVLRTVHLMELIIEVPTE